MDSEAIALAREFDSVAGTARGADIADNRQHNVLGCHTGTQGALHPHLHVFRFLLDQALGGEHVLDFGGADAERQRTERAVRRGMRVTADYRHTGQGGALFGADDMHDTLAYIIHVEFIDAEVLTVLIQGLDLHARDRVGNTADPATAPGGWHIVIGHRKHGSGAPGPAPGQPQPLERLRRGHLVDKVAVDVEQRCTIRVFADQVRVP